MTRIARQNRVAVQSPAYRARLRAAFAALYSPTPEIRFDEAMALREQWRREDEARRQQQAELMLRSSAGKP